MNVVIPARASEGPDAPASAGAPAPAARSGERSEPLPCLQINVSISPSPALKWDESKTETTATTSIDPVTGKTVIEYHDLKVAPDGARYLGDRSGIYERLDKPSGHSLKQIHCLELAIAELVHSTSVGSFVDNSWDSPCGLLTITVPADCTTRREGSRRLNSFMTNFVRKWKKFGAYVKVTEFQRNGRVHWHFVVVMPFLLGRMDWDAYFAAQEAFKAKKWKLYAAMRERYASSVSPALRRFWSELRKALKAHGLGRGELLPIRKGGDAVGKYVGKYLAKSFGVAMDAQKGTRRVQYSRRCPRSLRPQDFAWVSPGVSRWRRRVSAIANVLGVAEGDFAGLAARLGKKWAWRCRSSIITLDDDGFAAWLLEGLPVLVRYHQSALLWRPPLRQWHERTKRPGAGAA